MLEDAEKFRQAYHERIQLSALAALWPVAYM